MQALWTPSQARIDSTNLKPFMNAAMAHTGQTMNDYQALHDWSVTNLNDFWSFYTRYAKLPFCTSPENIKSDDPMPYTRWFEGEQLNYAQCLLYPPALNDDTQPAVIARTETGQEQTLSYAALRQQVARCANALKQAGIKANDRVSAVATNTPETLITFLACASIGAIFSSCSPDFGYEAANARFSQIKPRLLFASPTYYYGGKRFDILDTITELASTITSIEHVILLPYDGEDTPQSSFTNWQDWLHDDATLTFEQLEFDHPLYILFSSGTTGLPKAMVHRAGGALLKHHSEHLLHCDIKPGDKVFYFSTCGWMMWNWLLSVLAQAATIMLYEGSPGYPTMDVLWSFAEKHNMSFFGTSARYLHTLDAQNVSPKCTADLSALKTIASTGSPLSPAGFSYVYREIKDDVHLASVSGGTDIVGCFMMGVPTLPVYAGQIQGPALGVDLAAYNSNGQAVKEELGELVCRQPLPSMPLRFWNDPEGTRYKEAYFSVYPGVWRHGDLIMITPENGISVYGRSDATLNPGGVRIGTAEIYRPLEDISDITEACAVGKKINGDEVIWLFVVLKDGVTLDDTLSKRIKQTIRQKASPRHVPANIIQVSQLPRTRSGKAMEIAVSRLVNNMPVPNRNVIANPDALDEIQNIIS